MADIQNLPQYQFAKDRYESGCEKARESRLPDYMGCANTLPPQKRDSPSPAGDHPCLWKRINLRSLRSITRA